MLKNPEERVKWLGENGFIDADGGASDGCDLLLNPIPNARRVRDKWFNFCHPSTRFLMEETFGRWKNRFRFLLFSNDLSHKRMTNLIYASCIMHNACTILNDMAIEFTIGAAKEWQDLFQKHERIACPGCMPKKTASDISGRHRQIPNFVDISYS